MLSARLCQVSWSKSYTKSVPVLKSAFTLRVNVDPSKALIRNDVRHIVNSGRIRTHTVRRKALVNKSLASAGETAFSIGKGAVAGGAVVGLGALCYYGLGLSSEAGAIHNSALWPQYVKDRIKSTYLYFGGSIAISAASAAAVFSNPRLVEFLSSGGLLSLAVTLAALVGSGLVLQNIPYSPGFGKKQLAWVGHSALIGAVLAPMAFLGGPVLLRAAWYTAGIVGGLSTVALCAPSEKFLNLGGPLAIGLGAVFASSVGTMFLPPASVSGSVLYSFSLYGGLLLFSVFLLYDTQRIIHNAEKYPPDYTGVKPFDPVNMSVSIYLNVVNIFIRMATILSGYGSNRKR